VIRKNIPTFRYAWNMEATRWLDPVEMRAWRNFVELVGDVTVSLDEDLLTHGVTFGDYEVLVFLSEAPDRQMRMCDLAGRLRLTPSGLTRRLDGLVKAGYVDRRVDRTDRRVTNAVLTDAGFDHLVNTAPHHVASVRRQLLQFLDHEQTEQLGTALETIKIGRQRLRKPAEIG
jgi:DNA-binding MarR family transcriptional regulator